MSELQIDPVHLRIVAASGAFFPAWYAARSPDAPADALSSLRHYLGVGWTRGHDPSPFFSISWYLGHSPDVAAIGLEPLTHYLIQGWREGRSPFPGFDQAEYARAHDLVDLDVCPLVHLLARARLPLPEPIHLPDADPAPEPGANP